MKKAKTKLFLDARVSTVKNPGTHPVTLQIYHNRKRVHLTTGVSVTPEEFEKMMRPNPRDPKLRAYKSQLENIIGVAEGAIKKMGGNFKLEKVKHVMQESMGRKRMSDLMSVFNIYISNLNQSQRVRTADSYRNAKSALLKFDPELDFDKLTSEKLEEFEDWMVNTQGNAKTTVGIYLRSLKAIYNFAIQEGIVDRKDYPFGRKKYVIPTGKNVKKALTKEQIRAIFDFKTIPGTTLDRAKDLFLFSYFVNGINFRDIVELKNKDFANGQIQFVRTKTARTKRDYSPIKAIVRKEALEIINKWKNPDSSPDAYLFPFLDPGLNATQIARKVQDLIKHTNLALQQIGSDLGISFPLTTYVARHSFATIALNHGNAPLATISAALGHSSLETTKNYLDSLDDKNLRNISDSLL